MRDARDETIIIIIIYKAYNTAIIVVERIQRVPIRRLSIDMVARDPERRELLNILLRI